MHWEQAERILDLLCARLVSGKKEQDREIASIALKTVINEISGAELSGLVVKNMVPKLLQGMQSKVAFPLLLLSLALFHAVRILVFAHALESSVCNMIAGAC